MDLRHLRYVQKIASERSFSKAAEKLYLAQPALSQYILNLERELGTKLFDRTKNPISLTYAGEIFLQKANIILSIANELHEELKDVSKNKKGRLKIAISPNRASYALPKILPTFSQIYPNIHIQLLEGLTSEFEELLLKDEADVAIWADPVFSDKLEYVPIQDEYILLALPPEHPFIEYAEYNSGDSFPRLSLNLFKDTPFILSKPGQGLRGMADKLFAEQGFKPNVYTETRSFETAHRLVLAGLGVAFSASTLGPTNLSDPLKYFMIKEKTHCRTIYTVYKKRKEISWITQEFISTTKDTMNAYSIESLHLPNQQI